MVLALVASVGLKARADDVCQAEMSEILQAVGRQIGPVTASFRTKELENKRARNGRMMASELKTTSEYIAVLHRGEWMGVVRHDENGQQFDGVTVIEDHGTNEQSLYRVYRGERRPIAIEVHQGTDRFGYAFDKNCRVTKVVKFHESEQTKGFDYQVTASLCADKSWDVLSDKDLDDRILALNERSVFFPKDEAKKVREVCTQHTQWLTPTNATND